MSLLRVMINGGDEGGRPVVLGVGGDIDMASKPEFQVALSEGMQRAAQAPVRCLVIDLSDVAFFASAGAAALVEAEDEADLLGVKLRVVAVGVVQRVMNLTQIDSLFEMYASRDSALDI